MVMIEPSKSLQVMCQASLDNFMHGAKSDPDQHELLRYPPYWARYMSYFTVRPRTYYLKCRKRKCVPKMGPSGKRMCVIRLTVRHLSGALILAEVKHAKRPRRCYAAALSRCSPCALWKKKEMAPLVIIPFCKIIPWRAGGHKKHVWWWWRWWLWSMCEPPFIYCSSSMCVPPVRQVHREVSFKVARLQGVLFPCI